MNIIIKFFSLQKLFVFSLLILVILPFIAMCLWLPEIPLVQYFFIIILVMLKLIVFNEPALKHKIREKVRVQLHKEMGKPPSNKQIFDRIVFHITARDISLSVTGLLVIITAIVYEKF